MFLAPEYLDVEAGLELFRILALTSPVDLRIMSRIASHVVMISEFEVRALR
jgi:hypothetical protein